MPKLIDTCKSIGASTAQSKLHSDHQYFIPISTTAGTPQLYILLACLIIHVHTYPTSGNYIL